MPIIGWLKVTKMAPALPGLIVAELTTASTPQVQPLGWAGSNRISLISSGLVPVFLNRN